MASAPSHHLSPATGLGTHLRAPGAPLGGAPPKRVLVVDDSCFMQRRLTEILHSVPDLRVIGCADNGADAIRLAETLAPDVITMDINMAKVDGLHAIDYIMRSNPRPIVIISSYTRKGSVAALHGLDLGVIDIVEKPSSSGVALDIADRAAEIITKVRTAARVRVVRTLRGAPASQPILRSPAAETRSEPIESADHRSHAAVSPNVPRLIVIGASTGGPVALHELLRSVPHESFPPLVIVQHLPEKFTQELACQIDAVSPLHVVEAHDGQSLQTGTAYVAPGGSHLEVNCQGSLVIQDGPKVNHCKPSVDVLFHSAARHYGPRVLAFVLTGMGEDGAAGALAIKRAGGCVVAQDEASCIVFGMPAAAIEAGGVDEVLSLSQMKSLLLSLAERARGSSAAVTAHGLQPPRHFSP